MMLIGVEIRLLQIIVLDSNIFIGINVHLKDIVNLLYYFSIEKNVTNSK